MKRKNQRTKQAGTALVEATLTMLLYCMIVFSLFDFGYVMYLHQTIVDRARAAARYGSLNPTDTTGMKNVVLYYSATGSGAAIFGLQTSNVSATRSGVGTTSDRVTIVVSGFSYFAVWPGSSSTGKPITVSIPVENN
jgi:Flp pilus assembly protein TadG